MCFSFALIQMQIIDLFFGLNLAHSSAGAFACVFVLCRSPLSRSPFSSFLLLAPVPVSLPLGHDCYHFVPQSLLFVLIYKSG